MSNQELAATLNDLASKLIQVDNVEDRLAKGNAELKSTQDLLASVKKELNDAQTGLTAQQKKNSVAFDEDIRTKLQELDAIKQRTIDAKTALDTVNAELKSATAKHEGMEASINAMRQKFN